MKTTIINPREEEKEEKRRKKKGEEERGEEGTRNTTLTGVNATSDC